MERRGFYTALLIISVFLIGNAEHACAQTVTSFSNVDSDDFIQTNQENFEQNNSDEIFTVNPYVIVEAEDFHEQSGTQIVANGNAVAYIGNGDYLRFDNVQFDNGPINGGIRASSATAGGTIEFRTGINQNCVL